MFALKKSSLRYVVPYFWDRCRSSRAKLDNPAAAAAVVWLRQLVFFLISLDAWDTRWVLPGCVSAALLLL